MRRPKTILLAILSVIVLIALLFALTGLQQTLFHLFWGIFQLKYLIFLAIGLIIGFFAGTIYTLRKQNKENE